MSEELKPCPFCGGQAAQFDGIDRENKKSSSVICLECGCKVFRADGIAEEAIKAWNTRPAGIHLTVEELEGMKHSENGNYCTGWNALIDELIERVE